MDNNGKTKVSDTDEAIFTFNDNRHQLMADYRAGKISFPDFAQAMHSSSKKLLDLSEQKSFEAKVADAVSKELARRVPTTEVARRRPGVVPA